MGKEIEGPNKRLEGERKGLQKRSGKACKRKKGDSCQVMELLDKAKFFSAGRKDEAEITRQRFKIG